MMRCLGRYLVAVSIVILTITLLPLCDVLWMKAMTVYANDALGERLKVKSIPTTIPAVELPNFRVYHNIWKPGQGSIKAAPDSTSSNPTQRPTTGYYMTINIIIEKIN